MDMMYMYNWAKNENVSSHYMYNIDSTHLMKF